ncbi:Rv3235 family protein [Pseudonocardia spinosispora]|uniref:Rv3235 family protein n=1 Tax=Pseudonocardia spinosispora TaxID=103441 RepID=UPI00041BE094|nr:Rv3235 family protein [Pseudonocardia spinosispora]
MTALIDVTAPPVRRLPVVRPLPEPDMALAPKVDAPPLTLDVVASDADGTHPDVQRRLRDRVQIVLRLALEVVTGRRPAAQLRGLVTDPVLRYIRAAAEQNTTRNGRPPRTPTARPVGRPGLRTVHICRPDQDVAEVSVVWQLHGRCRAVAARFEITTPTHGERHWRCTELRLG